MVTKTITVKDSTGHLYAGAQVQTIYYIDGANDETFSSITTTNASGQATITYPSLAAYEAVLIEPPASDQINALTYVCLLYTSPSPRDGRSM